MQANPATTSPTCLPTRSKRRKRRTCGTIARPPRSPRSPRSPRHHLVLPSLRRPSGCVVAFRWSSSELCIGDTDDRIEPPAESDDNELSHGSRVKRRKANEAQSAAPEAIKADLSTPENTPLEAVREVLSKSDSIMEPNVFEHIQRFIECAGQPQEAVRSGRVLGRTLLYRSVDVTDEVKPGLFSRLLQRTSFRGWQVLLLSSSYKGYAEMCNLLADWLRHSGVGTDQVS